MLETLTRYWWAVVLRGAAAILFGIMALIWPDITVIVLVALFGAYALVDGVISLTSAISGRRGRGRRGWLIFEGIASILLGVLTFLWPDITALVLLWVIAVWALATGVLEIAAAVRLRREIQGEWLLALGGILSVLFGILLIVWPAAGALAVIFLIGIYAIVFGAALVGLGLRLRRIRRDAGVAPDTRRPAAA